MSGRAGQVGSEQHERINGTIHHLFRLQPGRHFGRGHNTFGRKHADAGAFWVLPPGRFAAVASRMADTFVCTTSASPVTFCGESYDQKDRTPPPWSSSNHRCGAVKGRRGSNLPVQWREREGPESAAKLSLPDALVKVRSQSDLPTLAIVHRKPGVRCIHYIGPRKAPRANAGRRLRDQRFQPRPLRIPQVAGATLACRR